MTSIRNIFGSRTLDAATPPALALVRRFSVAAALGLLLGLCACGGDSDPASDEDPGPPLGAPCSTEARAGLNVVVEGAAACDDLSFDVAGSESLGADFGCFGQGTCDCYGLWEQPGSFSVTVSETSTGATLGQLPDVVVGSDDCHVITEIRTLEL